jgi:hypothetical protein
VEIRKRGKWGGKVGYLQGMGVVHARQGGEWIKNAFWTVTKRSVLYIFERSVCYCIMILGFQIEHWSIPNGFRFHH